MGTDAPETVADPGIGTPAPGPAPTGDDRLEPTPKGAGGPAISPAGQKPGGEPPPEDAQPPWASIDGQPFEDAYGALEHPSFQPVLERRDRDLREGAVAQGRAEAEQSFNRGEAVTVIDKVSGIVGTALEKLGDGDAEGAERLVARIEQLVAPYGQTFLESVKDGAITHAYNSASKFFRGELKKGLPLKAQHELEDFALTQTSWGPVLKKRDELLRPGIEAEIERMRTNREGKEAGAEKRDKTKPPVKPQGGGGGGRLTAAQLDKMTPEQVAAQDQAEVDRALAEET